MILTTTLLATGQSRVSNDPAAEGWTKSTDAESVPPWFSGLRAGDPEDDDEEQEFPWWHVDFRRWSPTCDWSNYLLTLPSDGLVVGAE